VWYGVAPAGGSDRRPAGRGSLAEHALSERRDHSPFRSGSPETRSGAARSVPAAALAALQRSVGNQAVGRLLARHGGRPEQLVAHPGATASGIGRTPAVVQRAPEGGWDAFQVWLLKTLEANKYEGNVPNTKLVLGASQEASQRDWMEYLRRIGDAPFDDRGSPDILRVLGYQSGEMNVHGAAALLSGARLEIYYGTAYFVQQYARRAQKEGRSLLDLYKSLHRRDPGEYVMSMELLTRVLKQALEMRRFYLDLGVEPAKVRVCIAPDDDLTKLATVTKPKEATQIVSDRFARDLRGGKARLAGVFKGMDPSAKERVFAYYRSRAFVPGEACVLLWARTSGKVPGGAYPDLDTNKVVMAQLIEAAHRVGAGRKLVVIGDAVFKSLEAKEGKAFKKLLAAKCQLVLYWDELKLSRIEQLYFLYLLHRHNDAIACGMESGILEMPAFLGMKTIYLEPSYMREWKGLRWALMSGRREGGEGPAPVPTLRRLQFGGDENPLESERASPKEQNKIEAQEAARLVAESPAVREVALQLKSLEEAVARKEEEMERAKAAARGPTTPAAASAPAPSEPTAGPAPTKGVADLGKELRELKGQLREKKAELEHTQAKEKQRILTEIIERRKKAPAAGPAYLGGSRSSLFAEVSFHYARFKEWLRQAPRAELAEEAPPPELKELAEALLVKVEPPSSPDPRDVLLCHERIYQKWQRIGTLVALLTRVGVGGKGVIDAHLAKLAIELARRERALFRLSDWEVEVFMRMLDEYVHAHAEPLTEEEMALGKVLSGAK
jgi:hypothetical protein